MVVTDSVLQRFRSERLRKLLAVMLFGVLPFVAGAESSLEMQTHYYDMGPGLSIAKPALSYTNNLSLDTIVNGRFTVDRVASGEVDSMSSASQYFGGQQGHVDIRQEYLAGVEHATGDWKLNGGYIFSYEKDYISHSPSLTLAKDFNLRNTTLALGYAHNFDQVNGTYMSQARDKDVDNYSLSLTQVLSRSSLTQISYTMQDNSGYLATGNRQVVLDNGAESDEYLPSSRLRQALGMRFVQWLPMESALHLGYRFYHDDWEMDSHTLQAKLYHNVSDRLTLRAEYRFYTQQAVYFSKSIYYGTEKYLTAASSLRGFDTHLLGFKVSYNLHSGDGDWRMEGKYERYTQTTGLAGNIVMFSLSRLFP